MSNNEEQQFSIQPHPATSNNPSQRFKGDDAEQTAGLGGAPNLSHLHDAQKDPTGGKGPHIPSKEIAESLEKPKSREELQAAAAKLNE